MRYQVKKIVIAAALTASILMTSYSFAGCRTSVQACNNNPGNIPLGQPCTNYYTNATVTTTTTYCTQCSVCIPGSSDCVKGALGCHACTTKSGVAGTACSGQTNACTDGGGNYSCAVN